MMIRSGVISFLITKNIVLLFISPLPSIKTEKRSTTMSYIIIMAFEEEKGIILETKILGLQIWQMKGGTGWNI